MVDADFGHFEGLSELNMGCCMAVTDATFVHLRGIRVLDMWFCNQLTIYVATFANLESILKLSFHSLVIGACHNEGDDDDIQDDDAASEEVDAEDEAEEGWGMGLNT